MDAVGGMLLIVTLLAAAFFFFAQVRADYRTLGNLSRPGAHLIEKLVIYAKLACIEPVETPNWWIVINIRFMGQSRLIYKLLNSPLPPTLATARSPAPPPPPPLSAPLRSISPINLPPGIPSRSAAAGW